jgi:hypothetical protein
MPSYDDGVVSGRIGDTEQPTGKAQLRIFLVDPAGRQPPAVWHRDLGSPAFPQVYSRDGSQRIRTAIRTVLRRSPWGHSPGQSQDLIELRAGSTNAALTALTAFYLAAEQAMQPGEPAYDVDQGLQRFSAWLDDHTEP